MDPTPYPTQSELGKKSLEKADMARGSNLGLRAKFDRFDHCARVVIRCETQKRSSYTRPAGDAPLPPPAHFALGPRACPPPILLLHPIKPPSEARSRYANSTAFFLCASYKKTACSARSCRQYRRKRPRRTPTPIFTTYRRATYCRSIRKRSCCSTRFDRTYHPEVMGAIQSLRVDRNRAVMNDQCDR